MSLSSAACPTQIIDVSLTFGCTAARREANSTVKLGCCLATMDGSACEPTYGLLCRVRHGFDLVAVRVEDERAEIVNAIVFALEHPQSKQLHDGIVESARSFDIAGAK